MLDRREAREVAVEAGHGAVVLKRDCSNNRIGDQVTGGVRLLADPTQQREMPAPWLESEVLRMGARLR